MIVCKRKALFGDHAYELHFRRRLRRWWPRRVYYIECWGCGVRIEEP